MSKTVELAKKLKALADRGIGGEKTNAETMLQALLTKNGLTIEDVEGEATAEYFIQADRSEASLLNQIVKRVNYDLKCYGPIPRADVRAYGWKGNFHTTCTVAEYIEIEQMFNTYRKLYKTEMDVFWRAFCTANDLLSRPPEGKRRSTDDLTPEELAEYLRAATIAESIKKETFRKQLKPQE